jgi:hypothetical protein
MAIEKSNSLGDIDYVWLFKKERLFQSHKNKINTSYLKEYIIYKIHV